jgi:hypothetical protein
VLGIFFAFRKIPALTLIGASLIFFGTGGFFAHIPTVRKLYKKEDSIYALKFKKRSSEIVRIIERANELLSEAE